MGEPSIAGPASPGDGLHDDGDPSVEEIRDAAATSSGLAGVGTEPMGDAPSSATQGPPTVAEQASMAREVLGCSVQAW